MSLPEPDRKTLEESRNAENETPPAPGEEPITPTPPDTPNEQEAEEGKRQ